MENDQHNHAASPDIPSWIVDLSNMILGGEPDVNTSLRCPAEVVAIVAEFIAGDGDLDTLSKLNRACKDVHQETLPILYETVRFASERALERSVGFTCPSGWKFTRFLHVTENTLSLLRFLLRYHSKDLSSPKPGLKHLFPKLALIVSNQLCKGERYRPHAQAFSHPIHLSLYQSLALPNLLSACQPFEGNPSHVGINFFGTYYSMPMGRPRRAHVKQILDIVGLVVKSGASISGVSGTAERDDRHLKCAEMDFYLEIENEDSGSNVDGVLVKVVDHLCGFVRSLARRAESREGRLNLKCNGATLERFIDMFQERQPLYLALSIELTNICSVADMRGYIIALAEAYSLHWRHQPLDEGLEFASIVAPADVMLPGLRGLSDISTESRSPAYDAHLSIGNSEVDPEEHGFSASVTQTLLINGRGGDGLSVWRRAYPLAHMPVAPPTAAQMQYASAFDRDRYLRRTVEQGNNGITGAPGAQSEA